MTIERLSRVGYARFLREHPDSVVDVWASWCVPCRRFAPVFEAAATAWSPRVAFAKLQSEREPTLVAQLGIRSIPTLLFFRAGTVARREVGAISPDRLDELLGKTFGRRA